MGFSFRCATVGFGFVVATLCLPKAVTAEEAQAALLGNWHLQVKCADYAYENNLTFTEATTSSVIGSAKTDSGNGKIVGGSFDGQTAKFSMKFKWKGKNETESWVGRISVSGKKIKGKFASTLDSRGCSYSGSKS